VIRIRIRWQLDTVRRFDLATTSNLQAYFFDRSLSVRALSIAAEVSVGSRDAETV